MIELADDGLYLRVRDLVHAFITVRIDHNDHFAMQAVLEMYFPALQRAGFELLLQHIVDHTHNGLWFGFHLAGNILREEHLRPLGEIDARFRLLFDFGDNDHRRFNNRRSSHYCCRSNGGCSWL